MKLINQSGLLIIFSVLLIASVVTNFWLYQELRLVYLSWYATSLNPLGIQRYSQNPQKQVNKENKNRVVLFGDSRIVEWRKPDLEEWEFINRGIGGQTSAQVLLRFNQHVAILNPDIIVVQVCINDLRMLTQSLDTRQDIVNNCQQNITQIVDKAQKIGAKVILTTVFPLGEGNIPLKQRLFWPSLGQMKQDINQVNDYIRTLEREVLILDADKLLTTQAENPSQYYRDLLHLNRQGYRLLNQKLESILTQL
ncbi:MAG: SGNH/GDSL hydrolase family protein [Xenococcaceae cyanobacterium]